MKGRRGTGSTFKCVVACVAVKVVRTAEATDGVWSVVAVKRVVARFWSQDLGLDKSNVPCGIVFELDVLHAAGGCAIGLEIALHVQAVLAVIEAGRRP